MGLVFRYVLLYFIVSLVTTGAALAQAEVRPDTVRLVRIGDSLRVLSDTMTFFHQGAVVLGARTADDRSAGTVQRIRLADIERSDASSVGDVARLIPSAHVQTNSRGETHLYLRNSGERQLAVYFDGAPLNIPWDDRVDLDLIPTTALASISVSKGAASSGFGSNVMGGAVNLISRDLSIPGYHSESSIHAGSGGARTFDATHLGKTESFSYLASVGYTERDGLTLPGDPDLPFSQSDPDTRTNTDFKRFNAFARGEYTFDSNVGVSLAAVAIDARKGIAPEGHKNPDDGGVRFWRYPDWTSHMLIARIARPSGDNDKVGYQAATWLNRFEQRIVAYDSDAYDIRTGQEHDEDLTIGGRLIVTTELENARIRFSTNVSQSYHDQVDTEFSLPQLQLPPMVGPKQQYRQRLLNAGIEADYSPGRATYSAGINLDARSIQEADVFLEPDGQVDVGMRGGVGYDVPGPLEVSFSVGRRSRFPTLREQFSDALGRFVLNPELSSERAILTESSVTYAVGNLRLEAIGFLTLTSEAIDQKVVIVDDVARRMRVNLDGSRNLGVELTGSYRPIPGVSVAADLTLSRLRAENSETGSFDIPLTERPETTGSLRMNYSHISGASAATEILYTGGAFSLGEEGAFVELEASTVINLRGSYRVSIAKLARTSAELFARLNNVGDVVVESQLGLPGPGRTAIVGLKLSM